MDSENEKVVPLPGVPQPVKVTGKRSPRWAIWSRMEIPSPKNSGEVYLARLRIIQTPLFGVYLHWINEPDGFDPHDHPWNFWSLILRGGYTERIWDKPLDIHIGGAKPYNRRWNRFTWHKMNTHTAHRIVKADNGTVTLILTGKRVGTWGFWTPNGWIEWNEYSPVMA